MKFQENQMLPGGFRVVSVIPVKSMNAEVRRFEHVKSGARIVHVASADTENCFCICLPTPPPDDTGMPHILEHMTLAGSEKYPCKEPFFEMIKRSMATFINALTGNDMTYYPVSSNVHKDL
ncbi:MAG: insulinase family protein, partial [Kiritimatiellae bacterium]|nr:insulinase family protein [Kiritimatiellia bacterium]